MRLLIRSIAVAIIAVGIFLGAVGAAEEEYEGASYCRDYPAWPNGSYLGQMHPYHSDFYTRFAERRGWNPCETWANDQRNSAVRGLRELGHTFLTPPEVEGFTHTVDGYRSRVSEPFALPDGRYRVITRLQGNHSPRDSTRGDNFNARLRSSEGNTAFLRQTVAISGHWERVLEVGSGRDPEASSYGLSDPIYSSPIFVEIRDATGWWSVTFERIG